MRFARFKIITPGPTEKDLKIWLEKTNGQKVIIDPEYAKTVKILKLKTRRASSVDSGTSGSQPEGGGANPTDALQ